MKLATEVSQITEETWILTFYGLYVLSYSPGMHKRTGQRSCPSCLLEPATSRTAVSLRQKAVAGELFWVSFPGIQLRGQEMSLDGSFEGEQHKEGEDCCIKKAINGKHWEKVLMMLKKGQNWFCLQDKGTVRAPSQLSDFGSILWALHGKWNKPFVFISITNK